MLGLCASLRCDCQLLIGRKNLVEGDAGEGDQWCGDQGEVDHHALLNHQTVLPILLIPSHKTLMFRLSKNCNTIKKNAQYIAKKCNTLKICVAKNCKEYPRNGLISYLFGVV